METKKKGLTLLLLNKKSLFVPEARLRFSQHLTEFYRETTAENMLMEALKKTSFKRERQKFVKDLLSLRETATLDELNTMESPWCQRFRDKFHDHSKALDMLVYVVTNHVDIFNPMVFHVLNIPGEQMEWIVSFLQGDFLPEDVKSLEEKMETCVALNDLESVVPHRLRPAWQQIKEMKEEDLITYAGVSLTLKIHVLQLLVALKLTRDLTQTAPDEVMKRYQLKTQDSVLEKLKEVGQNQPWVQHFME